MKTAQKKSSAILLGTIVNYAIAALGAIFCIYGIYIQVLNNL